MLEGVFNAVRRVHYCHIDRSIGVSFNRDYVAWLNAIRRVLYCLPGSRVRAQANLIARLVQMTSI